MTNIFEAFREHKRAHASPYAAPTEPAGSWSIDGVLSGPAPPETRVRARRALWWRNDPTPPLLRQPLEARKATVAKLREEHPEIFPPRTLPSTSPPRTIVEVCEDYRQRPCVLSEEARRIFRERSQ